MSKFLLPIVSAAWCWRLRQSAMALLLSWSMLLAAPGLDRPESRVQAAMNAEVERGYTVLLQASSSPEEAEREPLFASAVKIFKDAYQEAGRDTQLYALLGAAQSYMAMRHPRRVFPFLWQATPLQRAEKILQQALVLTPDNPAALLLFGLVTWRQAASLTTAQAQEYQRGQAYLRQARAHGVPVYTPPDTPPPGPHLGLDDTLLLVRFLDVRRTGHADDLLLVFRTAARPDVCFGLLVSAQQAYALSSDAATGAMIPAAALTALAVVAAPQEPGLVVRFHQPQGEGEARFLWDGQQFVQALPRP